ncbi:hypothetical protein ACSBR2_020124 [Camellia fascicularis]
MCFLQMEDFMMLLCCYRSTNVAYSLQLSDTFAELVNYNDVDMRNMVCLARSFRLQLVDVLIELHQCGGNKIPDSDHAAIHAHNTAGDKVPSELEMDGETDLLQSFCPHKEKVFLSALWANGFNYIGQHSEGGASEFRNVLWKYTVNVASNSSSSKMTLSG